MAENVIHTRASRSAIRDLIRSIPREARSGGTAAQALLVRIGMEALARIRDAFVVKARGGTDESGLSWKPLAKSTVAYSRRHPGLPPPKVRAKSRPSYALTQQGRANWWKNYGQRLAMYKGDQGHAAAVAWLIAKEAGETTLMGLYGDTPVEILRDTGLLLNSLTPGVQSANQIFRTGAGEILIGTNRKWAAVHHHGVPGQIPQRRLWPSPRNWPQSWWTGLIEQARMGILDLVSDLLKRRS